LKEYEASKSTSKGWFFGSGGQSSLKEENENLKEQINVLQEEL